MRIEYLGHSCFYLRSEAGTTVMVDPYDGSVGHKVPSRRADYTLITHAHFDHDNLSAVVGATRVVQGSGTRGDDALAIRAVLAAHDAVGGRERGLINMMRFEMDGVRVVHLSDLGHRLEPEQIGEIGPVDVVLVPVGGPPFTIDGRTAREVVDQLQPRLAIPMHFRTATTRRAAFPIDGVEPFLEGFRHVETVRSGIIDVTSATLPTRLTACVLTPTM